jgi:E2/UBC family protein E
MNDQLAHEIEELKRDGFALQLHQESNGWLFIVIESYLLPKGYSQELTPLLIKVPPNYPLGGLDMFWMHPQLLLSNGSAPANTCIEQHLGQSWLRFSWHPHKWSPSSDSIASYLKFIDRRLEQKQ